MNLFEKFIHSMEGLMERPGNYGWFHLMFVGIVIIGTILLCIFGKNCNKKTFNLIIMIGWIVIFVLEVYKQLVFSFELVGDVPTWDYQWYAFPYQLCSTPLYILPFIFLLKEGKVKDATMAYIMTFSLFGGLAVFFYPNDVFVETIGINIQTMIHHGTQIVLGIFVMVYNRKRLDIKFWLRGIYVFAALVSIALILNISVYHIFVAKGINETFNMFYVGPYFDCTLPLLSIVYPKIPYICFILLYILGFVLISYIIYIVEKGIYKLASRGTKNELPKETA